MVLVFIKKGAKCGKVNEYSAFIKKIKALIYRRQYEAMKQVNVELIQLYWEIGKEIDDQQNEKGWGKSIVEVNQTNFDETVPEKYRFQAKLAVKDDYTLKTTNKPIGVATYSFYETLPEDMKSLLPSPDKIATIIADMERA